MPWRTTSIGSAAAASLQRWVLLPRQLTNPATKFEDPTTILSWVTSFNGSNWYHWKCERGHSACAESRDPWVGGQKQLHFWNPRPRFTCSLCNFGGYTMKIIKVICENNARPWVKTYEFLRMREITWSVKDALNVSAVVLDDVDLPYWTSKVEHIVRPFSALFVLRMRRNGYLWTSGVNLDNAVRSPDPENHTIEPKIMTPSYIQPDLWQFKDFPIETMVIFLNFP